MTIDDQSASPEERVAELEQEIERFREENEDLRSKRPLVGRLDTWAAGLGVTVALGGDLRKSLHAWVEAKSPGDPLPSEETVDLIASLLLRMIRVRWVPLLVGALVALSPVALLWWQSILIQRQNEALHQQIEQQAIQMEQQAADTLVVRRAQLLATIYDQKCKGGVGQTENNPWMATHREMINKGLATLSVKGMSDQLFEDSGLPPDTICRPKAHYRTRQEAVLAFCEIERGHHTAPSLRWANLSGLVFSWGNLSAAILTGANLRGADLLGADLARADLIGTDLSGAILAAADLSSASLLGASLSGASLIGANLCGADLSGASFEQANVGETDLSGADLRNARNLKQAQLDSAQGDASTHLPTDLRRPAHWSRDQILCSLASERLADRRRLLEETRQPGD